MLKIRKAIIAFLVAVMAFVSAPVAAQMVTYSWTTTSQGFGFNLGQPSTATFQVPLSAVQSGVIGYFDITNIQLSYPGLNLTEFTPSSIGLDNAVYVNPVTGALVFNNNNQGLAVVGYEGALFSDSFLSITIGNPVSNAVADQFNALKNGGAFAGFPTAGYWTATLPSTGGVPEPETWALLLMGFFVTGGMIRRERNQRRFTIA